MRTLDELGISPAPWRVDTRYGCVNGIIAANDDCIVETDSGVYPPEIADARLIAAAPMLYKCLREAVIESCHECIETAKCCPHKYDGGCFVTKWRDALAAASGESEEGETK